jgi:hypothetical protein
MIEELPSCGIGCTGAADAAGIARPIRPTTAAANNIFILFSLGNRWQSRPGAICSDQRQNPAGLR